MNLDHLSDDELESKLMLTCFQSNKLKAHILVYLIGIEDRRIDRRKAYSSMYDYCKRQLGMSGGQAYRRIAGARLVRRFPFLLERIERGEVHLTTLTQIASFITNENVHELVDATVGKNRDEVDRLLGKWFGIDRTYGLRSSSGIPVDDELAAMIQRARELRSHAVPSGDPMTLAKKAFALLIDQAERKTRGKADKPRLRQRRRGRRPPARLRARRSSVTEINAATSMKRAAGGARRGRSSSSITSRNVRSEDQTRRGIGVHSAGGTTVGSQS